MALTNSKLLEITNKHLDTVKVYNKEINNLLYTITVPSEIKSWVFDKTNSKLFTIGSDKKIYRYDLTDTAATLANTYTLTITTVPKMTQMDVDVVGNLYLIINSVSSNEFGTYTIGKINVDAADDITEFSVQKDITYEVWYTPYVNLKVYGDNIYLLHNGTTRGLDDYIPEEFRPFLQLNTDLAITQVSIMDQENFGMFYGSTSIQNELQSLHSDAYNPISKKLIKLFNSIYVDQGGQQYHDDMSHKRNINNITAYDIKQENYIRFSKAGNLSPINQFNNIFIGKYSGNLFHLNDGILNKYDLNGKHLYTGPIMATGITTDTQPVGAAFNDISEDFYVSNYTNAKIYRYNGLGHLMDENVVTDGYSTKYLLVAIGTSETSNLSNQIDSPVIIYPSSGSSITDSTPTIIFKAGTNPIGWTQQFRVVADTDASKLENGTPTDTYERAFDSWSAGANYTDCTWKYCTDYDETNSDPLNGTWNTLGTGVSGHSGKSMPDDGVSTDNDKVYIQMTIPSGDGSKLTGADSNTIWNFNIFSYSKY